MIKSYSSDIMRRLRQRLSTLYGEDDAGILFERLAMLVGRYGIGLDGDEVPPRWDQTDSILITYGDMVRNENEPPLTVLRRFLGQHVKGCIRNVHLLPFFPYSSDDGFSVIDYRAVDPEPGKWEQVQDIGKDYGLMFDLVLNHCSRESGWFKNYIAEVAPHRDYFIEVEPGTDLSSVVRPRVHDLLSPVYTRSGERWLWTTFSEDQLDLNFKNPDVLFDFLDILFQYIATGCRFIRLDAIAYLWKEFGTSCIHHPQTHEVVKFLRDLIDMVAPHVVLLTETNVPHQENISYFGMSDEAHMVYQFTLPPLLLHALQTGQSSYLTRWASALPDLPPGCTFFNFTASHDGIGVRPLEGILPEPELQAMMQGVTNRGGYISTKKNPDGKSESPYELNITYFDALAPLSDEADDLHVARFLCSQAVPLALRGIPGIYFNSLIAARNNRGGVEFTGQARTINREKWQEEQVDQALNSEGSTASRVFNACKRMFRVRSVHPAFHPDGAQAILDLGESVFVVVRTSPDDSQTVVAVHNFTPDEQQILVDDRIPHLAGSDKWKDLLGSRTRKDGQCQVHE